MILPRLWSSLGVPFPLPSFMLAPILAELGFWHRVDIRFVHHPPPSPPDPRHLLLQRLHHLPLEETLRPALLIQEMVCLAVPGEGEGSMQVTMVDLVSWLNVLNEEGSDSLGGLSSEPQPSTPLSQSPFHTYHSFNTCYLASPLCQA